MDHGGSIAGSGRPTVAGRDGCRNVARGIAQGVAPTIAAQDNQNVQNQQGAAGNLYSAGNTTGPSVWLAATGIQIRCKAYRRRMTRSMRRTMPYSAARLAGQTFEGRAAPVLRLVSQPQGTPDSSAFMRSPLDQAAASGSTPVLPEDMSELLKLRSIIQAVGSRGLFPI